jgi:hypothetical protein
MSTEVARQIEQLLCREVGGGDALEDLLVGGIGRLGRAPILADQRLDRRPVDDVERIERAAAIVARIPRQRQLRIFVKNVRAAPLSGVATYTHDPIRDQI